MSLFKKIMMWVGIFIGSGLGFLAIIFIVASLMTSGLKKPIERQLNAIRAEDVATAYSYTSSTFQANTSFETFKKFIEDYSALRNNEKISFDERSIDGNVGIVYATLTSRSKAKTPIVYRLIKEKDQWKIESMALNPSQDTKLELSTRNSPETNTTTSNSNTNKITPDTPFTPQPEKLTNYFQDQQYHFSMGYPENWKYYQPASGMVVFTNNHGKKDSYLISLQTLATYNNRSVQTVADQIVSVLNSKATNVRIIEDALVPTLQGKIYQGRYIVCQYRMNNEDILQLNVIYFKKPSKALFFFEYYAPVDQFNADLPSVKQMIGTFTAN